MVHKKFHNSENGFALLMSLIVVAVIISVGMTLLDVSIKQLSLSTNAKESDIAFHAANAGAECARYNARVFLEEMGDGDSVTLSCFGDNVNVNAVTLNTGTSPTVDNMSDAEAYSYTYSFTWGETNDRCTKIDTLVASTSGTVAGDDGATISNLASLFAGYPRSPDEKDCAIGSRCTIIAVKGYNRPCGSVGTYGTLEREVLIEF